MSDDSGPSKPPAQSIPSWQRAATDSQPKPDQPPAEDQKPTAGAQQSEEKQMTVAEKAVKWLEDPSIQNASRERKVAFLVGKGVARDDIDRLLPKKTAQQPAPAQDELKIVHTSQGVEKSVTAPTTAAAPVPLQPQAQAPPRREVPPVITYPEFLLQPQEKPPIVTTQRLANTAYVAGGLMATIYGLSEYLIKPMAESLTIARHEFLEHTASQVDELNDQLGRNVSKLPQLSRAAQALHQSADEEPPSPTDSDPTELFHRDIGTQTEQEYERPPTASSFDSEPTDITSTHESRLKSINSHIASLRTSSDAHTDGSLSELNTTVSDLTQYLRDMTYSSPYYSSPYNGIDGTSFGHDGNKDKSDGVDALKAEIRSVKGVLLSARNFPAGRPMAAGR